MRSRPVEVMLAMSRLSRPADGRRWSPQPAHLVAALSAASLLVLPAATTIASAAAVPATTTAWHRQTIPAPAGSADNDVDAVACSAANACTAVGDYVTGSQAYLGLAQRWNGTAWKVEPTPAPPGGSYVELTAVSCPSATSCFAVGQYDNSSHDSMVLAEQWNGTSWKLLTVPAPAGATTSQLAGVSCRSTASCEAVGGSYSTTASLGKTLAESWNGTSWKIQATPNPAESTGTRFEGVSCSSTTSCVAVGAKSGGTAYGPVVAETYNGKTWTLRTTPAIPDATTGTLSGVSCTASDACTAVGSSIVADHDILNLAERWNGTTWQVQTTPDSVPGGSGGSAVRNVLTGVSCTSATACTATGGADVTAATERTVAAGWNGSTWSLLTTVNPAGGASQLSGVTCTAAASCIAAGSFTASATGTFTSLVEAD